MALQNIPRRMPEIGRIYLGRKVETRGGMQRPTSTDFFVLDKLADHMREKIESLYGKEPKELDILFPSDDEEVIIPTSLVWYSSAGKSESGSVMGVKKCQGNGPDADGNPGVALHYAQRDPKTKLVPERPCLGAQCPDWADHQGRPQCRQTMQIRVILPLVSLFGVFVITTRSISSISSFHNLVSWVKKFNDGRVSGIPFKIGREEEAINFIDPNGVQRASTQHIMKLFPNEGFRDSHGKEVAASLSNAFKGSNILTSGTDFPPLALEAGLSEDHLDDLTEMETVEAEPVVAVTAESVVESPEIKELFGKLEVKLGKEFTQKQRLISIRKLEGAPDLLEEAIKTLTLKLTEELPA
jgi:hypothetical protein